MEQTGGYECRRACQSFHYKAALSPRESTRPPGNYVNFRNSKDIGSIRRFTRR